MLAALRAAAVYFRHCLEDLGGQAAALQRHVERLETVTLDAISLEVRNVILLPRPLDSPL